jgi:hypothetical protein
VRLYEFKYCSIQGAGHREQYVTTVFAFDNKDSSKEEVVFYVSVFEI